MTELFNLKNFDEYKEDNCREVKKAESGLPMALWETYSSFANSNGGVIILGVGERQDGSWYTTGMKNVEKLKKNFWNTIHDTKKVSVNLLSDKNVKSYEVGTDAILVIQVPRAKRDQKPVYINDDLFGGSYRRDWEGDYHCSKAEVKAMLRDAIEDSSDMKIIEQFDLSVINSESLQGYRNYHRVYKPEHVFHRLSDEEYLIKIGAAAKTEDGKIHPTAAGLLMFGEEYNIVREFPEYFLDYRETLDPTIRWTDRVQSSSGEWTGNIQDFFFKVSNKISQTIKTPFKLEGITRVDDTPVHKAVREALINCLVNADYYLPQGVVIKRDVSSLIIENPGSIRTGKKQMLKGGISDPRNKNIMKMFNLLGMGERAGGGIPDIYQVWEDQNWKTPIVEEFYNPDRTKLSLEFVEKQAIKTSDKNKRQKQAIKTSYKDNQQKQTLKIKDNLILDKYELIRQYLQENGTSTTNELAQLIGLSPSRTRAILKGMQDIMPEGANKNRKYRLKNDE